MPTIRRRAPRINTTQPQEGAGGVLGRGLSGIGIQLKKRGEKIRVDREEGFALEDSIEFHRKLNQFIADDLQRTISEGTEDNHSDNVDQEAQRMITELSSGRSREYTSKLNSETRTSRIYANGTAIRNEVRAVLSRSTNQFQNNMIDIIGGTDFDNFDPEVLASQKEGLMEQARNNGLNESVTNKAWDTMFQNHFEQLLYNKDRVEESSEIIDSGILDSVFKAEDGGVDEKRINRIRAGVNANRENKITQHNTQTRNDMFENEDAFRKMVNDPNITEFEIALAVRAMDITQEAENYFIGKLRKGRDIEGRKIEREAATRAEQKANDDHYVGSISRITKDTADIIKNEKNLDKQEVIEQLQQQYDNLIVVGGTEGISDSTRNSQMLDFIDVQDTLMIRLMEIADHRKLRGRFDIKTARKRRIIGLSRERISDMRSGGFYGINPKDMLAIEGVMNQLSMSARELNIAGGGIQDYISDEGAEPTGFRANQMVDQMFVQAVTSVVGEERAKTLFESEKEVRAEIPDDSIDELVGVYGGERAVSELVLSGMGQDEAEQRVGDSIDRQGEGEFVGPIQLKPEEKKTLRELADASVRRRIIEEFLSGPRKSIKTVVGLLTGGVITTVKDADEALATAFNSFTDFFANRLMAGGEFVGTDRVGVAGEAGDTSTLSKILTREEGNRGNVYVDTEGHLTAGIGHKLTKSEKDKYGKGDKVPGDQVKKWFEDDKRVAVKGAKRVVEDYNSLPEDAQTVLSSMVFQMGETGVKKFVNMRKHLNKRPFTKVDAEAAANEMLDSVWAKTQTPERARRMSELMRNSI